MASNQVTIEKHRVATAPASLYVLGGPDIFGSMANSESQREVEIRRSFLVGDP